RHIPALLRRAVAQAHDAVSAAALGHNTSTTLAMAVVVETSGQYTLYIANVGDSRIYLIRAGELIQLTMAHIYANVIPWFGEVGRDVARANTSAEALVYAVGLHKKTPADTGVYLQTDNCEQAAALGERGLLLQENDTVLICSDGCIHQESSAPYLTAREIWDIVREQ